MEPTQGQTLTGRVTRWMKRYGFVDAGLARDVFVHAENAPSDLRAGDRIVFDLTYHNGLPRALNARLVRRNEIVSNSHVTEGHMRALQSNPVQIDVRRALAMLAAAMGVTPAVFSGKGNY